MGKVLDCQHGNLIKGISRLDTQLARFGYLPAKEGQTSQQKVDAGL